MKCKNMTYHIFLEIKVSLLQAGKKAVDTYRLKVMKKVNNGGVCVWNTSEII
jgi:hypothetical protein